MYSHRSARCVFDFTFALSAITDYPSGCCKKQKFTRKRKAEDVGERYRNAKKKPSEWKLTPGNSDLSQLQATTNFTSSPCDFDVKNFSEILCFVLLITSLSKCGIFKNAGG